MSHSAFRKIVGLEEVLVMQKFSIVTDFLKFLFPRRWELEIGKILGHLVHSPASEILLPTVRFFKLLIASNLSD